MTSAPALVAREQFRGLRRGAVLLGMGLAVLVAANLLGFASAYPTTADRVALARSLGSSSGLNAILGHPLAIDTLAGFTQWRSLTGMILIGGIWGLLAATRTLRGAEEDGSLELVLAGPVSPAQATLAGLATLGGATAVAFVLVALMVLVAGAAGYGLDAGRCLLFAVTAAAPVAIFAAVGALASQLAPTRRQAAAIAGAIFAACFALRVAADSGAAGWLRWATPFGWLGQVHPLTGPRPAILLLPVAMVAACAWASAALARRRDYGAGLIRSSERRTPNLRLLGSPAAHALRSSAGVAVAWAVGAGTIALLLGVLAKAAADALAQSGAALDSVGKASGVDLASVPGYLGFAFLFIIVAVSCYGASLAGAVREEEATGRLDAVLTRPVARGGWLARRLGVAVVLLSAVSLTCGVLGWAGTELAGRPVDFSLMLQAGLNCLPAAILILGLGALAYGAVPRVTTSLSYGVIAAAFLVELVGGAIGAPAWVLDLSPFHHLAAVPAQSIDWGAAVVMVALGVVAGAAGAACFSRRDLEPA